MLYQGEDIAIRIKGDDTVKFTKDNFVVWIYPTHQTSKKPIELLGTNATQVDDEDNAFDLVIDHTITKDMPSSVYTIEVLLIGDDNTKRTIFQNREAFELKFAKIKDYTQQS